MALYVIYDICHSVDLQVHLGDQMQPPVQCGRKKKIVVPNGDRKVRVQGNMCESNFWQLLKVEFCKYVEKCLR